MLGWEPLQQTDVPYLKQVVPKLSPSTPPLYLSHQAFAQPLPFHLLNHQQQVQALLRMSTH
jgi:hypothetical protein